jgi:plasmid stabilization system protein ParE
LESIIQYWLETFGENQTGNYLIEIEKELNRLKLMPTIGYKRNDLPREYFSVTIGQHVFIYSFDEVSLEITVTRILHARMDFTKRV